MASTRFRRLWLITCLALLGGLTTAVPVNCLCEADQHWGQAIHPIFQHHHADGHDHRASDTDIPLLQARGDTSEVAFVVSEHGSLLSATMDGLLFGQAGLWLALGLFPLLTLVPSANRAANAGALAPPTGPPRRRALFS
jgi:hypothetical protein